MREAFEAWFEKEYPCAPTIPELRVEIRESKWAAWQAAYAAGMKRAAEIAGNLPCEWVMREECAAAIRVEIKDQS